MSNDKYKSKASKIFGGFFNYMTSSIDARLITKINTTQRINFINKKN